MFSQEQIKRIEYISNLPAEEQSAELREFLKELSPEQIEYLRKQQRCVICSIAGKQIQASIVYEDNENMAVMDINPANPGHVMLFPKNHLEFYWQTGESLDKIAKKLSVAIIQAVKANGLNVMIANGDAAGQINRHIAVHLIPRFKDDKVSLRWDAKEVKNEDTVKIAASIAGILERESQKNEKKKEMVREQLNKEDIDELDYRIP